MTVKLKFQPPSRKDAGDMPPVHDRTLEEVPRPEAWRMALDFARYKRDETQGRSEARRLRHKTYRYLQAGKEVEVGLDFEEIISLEVLVGQEGNGAPERRLSRDSEDR